MKRFLHAPVICLALLLSCLCACQKEVKGPKGDAGEPGQNGSENISSTEFVVPGPSWTVGPDSIDWVNTINLSSLTENVVKNGAVQVFINKSGIWYPLPYNEGDEFIRFGYGTNTLKLISFDTHYLLPPRPQTASYKLTVIAPR